VKPQEIGLSGVNEKKKKNPSRGKKKRYYLITVEMRRNQVGVLKDHPVAGERRVRLRNKGNKGGEDKSESSREVV